MNVATLLTLAAIAAPVVKQEAPQILWRAQRELYYEMDADWVYSERYDNRFNSAGLNIEQVMIAFDPSGNEVSRARTSTVYGNGNRYFTERITESSNDEGATWTPVRKIEREYDPIVPGVIINNAEYNWDGVAWIQNGNNYRRIITRNDKGNITDATVAVLYGGIYDPVDRLTITYGDDDRASQILHEVLTLDAQGQLVWGTSAHYANIRWDRTDGQIVNVQDLPTLANRMESANVRITDTEYGYLAFTYPDPEGSYRSTLRGNIDNVPATISASYTLIDPYGSYDYECTTVSGLGAIKDTYVDVEKYHLDEYGLETLIYTASSYNGLEEVTSDMRGAVEYDLAYGYPVRYIVSEPAEDDPGNRVEMIKVVYEDYVDCTGVESVTVDRQPDATAVYYDLTGRIVASPVAGRIYIERRGATQARCVKF